jgi:chaperonin cofactor prefoldin
MEWQTLFNLLAGSILAVTGWFARQIWDSVQDLKNDIHQIEVDLPTYYVKRVDIDTRFDKLENILERIFDRLEQKADKTP